MNELALNPLALLQQITQDVPSELHKNLFLTGSLAAEYHFKATIDLRAVNTKDADFVVHPSGNVQSTKEMILRLLEAGWRRHEGCHPQPLPEPQNTLRAVRLYPPHSTSYFVEFLNIPESEQVERLRWEPLQLSDGWYGLPSFKYYRVTSIGKIRSDMGLEY